MSIYVLVSEIPSTNRTFEQQRIKRKKQRWMRRLAGMPALERQALLSVIADSAGLGDATRS